MAMYAQQVGFFAVEIPRPLAMYPCFPVPVNVPMALAAEQIRLAETDQVATNQPQFVPVARVVAIKAPTLAFGMVQLDICVLIRKFPPFSIHLHTCMAGAAGEYPLGQGRRRHRELIMLLLGENGQTNAYRKSNDK